VSGAVLERGEFEPYPMIRRKFSDVKNKQGTILTSYGVRFWSVMSISILMGRRGKRKLKYSP